MSEKPLIGPALPPGFLKSRASPERQEEGEDDHDHHCYGPSLPPTLTSSSSSTATVKSQKEGDEEEESEDDDEVVIGPVLPTEADLLRPVRQSSAGKSLSTGSGREEWMLTPGESKKVANVLFPAKSFSKKSSSSEPIHPSEPSEKDERMAEALASFNEKKRASTLVEMHQDKMKKQKSDVKKETRQPLDFNPESDLHVRQFDSKQTKSVLNKAKLLNSRFSSGSNKFL